MNTLVKIVGAWIGDRALICEEFLNRTDAKPFRLEETLEMLPGIHDALGPNRPFCID